MEPSTTSLETPIEKMEEAQEELEDALATELLERIRHSSPAFFEQIVLDVLGKMGYGGAEPEALRRIGGPNDEGVDGVIDQDKLGLEQVYVQAKRWGAGNDVGRKEIQAFVGALAGQRASKGIFITASRFNGNAVAYVAGLSQKVILIDGRRLTELLIRYGVGVQTERVFEVKSVDDDYFIEGD